MKKIFYYDKFFYDNVEYIIVASEKGLVFVGCGKDKLTDLSLWYNNFQLIRHNDKIYVYKKEILNYLKKKEYNFNFQFDILGTKFQKLVWNELLNIPYGEIKTYKYISEKIKKPKSARAVANAISKNPLVIIIPCHRVIGSDGKLRGFRSGLDIKEKLINLETNK